MPKDKPVEARHQTSDKLEVMARYWSTWAKILAHADEMPFCVRHLWMIDACAGNGLHLSSTDPDGVVRGTAVQAALAARVTQADVPLTVVHVRAIEKRKRPAGELDRELGTYRAEGVDATVTRADWANVTPDILREIADEHHPHGGKPVLGRGHQHRSLWFIDPWGTTDLDRDAIESLPYGAEVIVNLDMAGLFRKVGKADRGDSEAQAQLGAMFGGQTWRGGAHSTLDQRYAETFASKFKHANVHALRQSGNQARTLIHLTNADKAATVFTKICKTATTLETLIAGSSMTIQRKGLAAVELFGRFRGQTLTTRDMLSVSDRYDLGQLRAICVSANDGGYGKWTARGQIMEWFVERQSDPTFEL